jgi:hypothetical protein
MLELTSDIEPVAKNRPKDLSVRQLAELRSRCFYLTDVRIRTEAMLFTFARMCEVICRSPSTMPQADVLSASGWEYDMNEVWEDSTEQFVERLNILQWYEWSSNLREDFAAWLNAWFYACLRYAQPLPRSLFQIPHTRQIWNVLVFLGATGSRLISWLKLWAAEQTFAAARQAVHFVQASYRCVEVNHIFPYADLFDDDNQRDTTNWFCSNNFEKLVEAFAPDVLEQQLDAIADSQQKYNWMCAFLRLPPVRG